MAYKTHLPNNRLIVSKLILRFNRRRTNGKNMIKVKSNIEKTESGRKVLIGDQGKSSLHYGNIYKVWLEKHRREFYWYPVTFNKDELTFL